MFRIIGLLIVTYALIGCNGESTLDLSGPAQEYQLTLFLNNKPIDGEVEIAEQVNDNPLIESAILEKALPQLERGSTYSMKVVVTDHLGNSADMIKSDRVKFMSFGCLTVEREGQLIALPRDISRCNLPDMPQLMIGIAREDDSKLLLNEYLFKIKD
ncbi:hypothetical protein [Marinagarivorans cellulosilyticus]|uniref:Lipoprotein n=1 Tax=Marinagarivorans cellulosilyticus TaxID=2721545 RepID=A0AAN1WHI0_9GAMM|nr:hypothetical protein [Marinagarivorans cellulosilyticus]BCD97702.1 hypothetical protein MARGE09_P1903 [Marinagarivorans cellulosilyticus]